MSTVMPSLTDINIPPHVKVEVTENFESLMATVGRRSMIGYVGDVFFGTAFIQGSRLQFTTAMPIQKMLEVSKIDRSNKKDNVQAVTERSNRPQEPSHGKQVRKYLLGTACTADKFILPSFTFNYGVGLSDDDPDVVLTLLVHGGDGTNTWPGILTLPQTAKLDTTDGAHRRSQIEEILGSRQVSESQKDALKRNAVDVKIVFESSRDDSHQDFADCGKAKAIPKSMVTTFDVRDRRNKRSRELVQSSDFLLAYVDATASNVNLSAKSRMIWSMSAIRMFVSHVVDHHSEPQLSEVEQTAGAEAFFAALVRYLPQLKALNRDLKEKDSQVTTGSLREQRGGDVALRGIGMAIFARAFLYCKESKMDFDEMARRLATVDWHVLKCEKSALPIGPDFASELDKNANPIWANLIVKRDSGYRIKSTSGDADVAWKNIRQSILSEIRSAA